MVVTRDGPLRTHESGHKESFDSSIVALKLYFERVTLDSFNTADKPVATDGEEKRIEVFYVLMLYLQKSSN